MKRALDILAGTALGVLIAFLVLGDGISAEQQAFLLDGAVAMLIVSVAGQVYLERRSRSVAHD